MSEGFRRAFACASLITVAAVSTPAAAQQIDRIVAFGDSYADDGNAFQLGYANPQALAVYSTGRFSGGSNYIDSLSSILQVPVDNFAIGGAFGGTNNGTLCYDAVYGAPLCGKGLQYEIDQFLNVGTQSSVFPTTAGTFGPNDLLTMSIGGNDARFYQQAGGTLASAPATGTAAAAATSVQLDRLVAAGAPTISYLAGDAGRLPEIAGSPSLAAIRSAYSGAFNTAMQTTLAGYASDGVVVHYLDLNVVSDNITANPTAYGITNGLVCPLFPNTTCVVNSSGYLFYGDALHLTSQGFAIVAQYVAAQLAAPRTLQAPSDLGLDTARQFGRTLSSRSDLYGRGGAPEGLHLFAIGDTFSRDIGASRDNAIFDIDGVGATIGAEYGLQSARVGIAGNYSRPRVRFGNDSARINAHSWQVGAYGSVAAGGLFGQAYLGYGKDKNRITRAGVVEDMKARPDGSHFTAGAKGGYLMPLGPVRIGPIAALDYARAKVDGYTESGDAALTLNVGKQSLKAMTGQVGLEARADLAGITPFAAVTAEHEFSGDDRLIHFAQTDAPTIVNQWTVTRRKDTYARISGGASATLWGSATIDAALTSTVGRNSGQEFGAQFGVRAKF
jgi:outer membrane lipase/esterase